jgi:hypothetical protein
MLRFTHVISRGVGYIEAIGQDKKTSLMPCKTCGENKKAFDKGIKNYAKLRNNKPLH